jgi:hypothetical protein
LQIALGDGNHGGEEIGGGMSRVFAACDLTLRRDILVKALPPNTGGDRSVERVKREESLPGSLRSSQR